MTNFVSLPAEIPNKGMYVSDEMDPRAIPPGYVVDCKNIEFNKDGCRTRMGYEQYPVALGTLDLMEGRTFTKGADWSAQTDDDIAVAAIGGQFADQKFILDSKSTHDTLYYNLSSTIDITKYKRLSFYFYSDQSLVAGAFNIILSEETAASTETGVSAGNTVVIASEAYTTGSWTQYQLYIRDGSKDYSDIDALKSVSIEFDYAKTTATKYYAFYDFQLDEGATVLPLADAITGVDSFSQADDTKVLIGHTHVGSFRFDEGERTWNLLHVAELCDCDIDTIDDWSDDANCTASISVDRKHGTGAIKIVYDGTAGAIATYDPTLALDDSGYEGASTTHSLCLWIKSSINQSANAIKIHVIDDAAGDVAHTIADALTADTWKFVRIDYVKSTSGTVDGITVEDDSGNAATVTVDSIYITKKLTGTSADIVDSEAIGDSLYWCNGEDVVSLWSSGYTRDYISDGDAPTTCKVLQASPHGDRLHLLNGVIRGTRYYHADWWSAPGVDDGLTTFTAAGWKKMSDTADPIVACLAFEAGRDVIHRRQTMWERLYIGSDAITYTYRPVEDGHGCAAGKTARRCGSSDIWLGWESVYLYDGQTTHDIAESIASALTAGIDRDNIGTSFATVDVGKSCYYLHVPKSGSSSPDSTWAYNWKYQTWSYYDYTDAFRCGTEAVLPYETNFKRWLDAVGTYGEQTSRWLQGGEPGFEQTLLYGDSSGYIHKISNNTVNDNGSAVAAWVTVRSEKFNTLELKDRHIKCTFIASGSTVTVSHSPDLGDTWLNEKVVTLTSSRKTYEYFCNTRARQITYRFKKTTVDDHFRIYLWYPTALPASSITDTTNYTA